MSDENRLAIWVHYVFKGNGKIILSGDATIQEMKAWPEGVQWGFWAWADEGVDE